MCQTGYSSFVRSYPDCLSKVEIAFSRGEEELCVDASQTTNPKLGAKDGVCALRCTVGSHTIHASVHLGCVSFLL